MQDIGIVFEVILISIDDDIFDIASHPMLL
jgi:hypothetical protein